MASTWFLRAAVHVLPRKDAARPAEADMFWILEPWLQDLLEAKNHNHKLSVKKLYQRTTAADLKTIDNTSQF